VNILNILKDADITFNSGTQKNNGKTIFFNIINFMSYFYRKISLG